MNFCIDVIVGIALIVLGGYWGFSICADDAEARLMGRKPIDAFWRERGMR